MKISVVIPVYNSERSLPPLVERLEPALKKLADEYELLLVDDCSMDRSYEVIRRLEEKHKWIKGFTLMRNYGQHNALLCGIRAARGEVIVTMDDDLQHPPEEIHKLLEKLDEGYDVVYGAPREEKHGIMRDLASQITKMALKTAMRVKTARDVNAFRAIRAGVSAAFSNYQNSFVNIDVLLTWGTKKITSVKVRHESREYGRSNYTFWKLVTHAVNMMTGFSALPLQLASIMGFVFSFFGFAVLIFTLARYFVSGRVVPGFAFLASIIAIFSGVQLFAIGIIGEYLARIHFRALDRPPYVVRNGPGKSETESGVE